MSERILTPVQNAMLNLVADTDYDAAISEAVRNETYADIIADYHTYNNMFRPMSVKERATWYETAWKEAVQKSQYWAQRLTYKHAERYPKWRKNMEFWSRQAKLYEAEFNKLSQIASTTGVIHG